MHCFCGTCIWCTTSTWIDYHHTLQARLYNYTLCCPVVSNNLPHHHLWFSNDSDWNMLNDWIVVWWRQQQETKCLRAVSHLFEGALYYCTEWQLLRVWASARLWDGMTTFEICGRYGVRVKENTQQQNEGVCKRGRIGRGWSPNAMGTYLSTNPMPITVLLTFPRTCFICTHNYLIRSKRSVILIFVMEEICSSAL